MSERKVVVEAFRMAAPACSAAGKFK